MSHYDYLGAAAAPKTPTGVEYVSTMTAEKDGFDSLFAAYRAAYPSTMNVFGFAKELCRINGIDYAIPAIERWIFGQSGKRFPLDPKNSPESTLVQMKRSVPADLKGQGWAHFAEGNTILLPNIPRADGKTPGKKAEALPEAIKIEPPAPVATAPWWKSPWVLGGGAVALVAAVALLGNDTAKKV